VNGERLDAPSCGLGHVPDNPTEQQAKDALLEANPLRAEWVKCLERQERLEQPLPVFLSAIRQEHAEAVR
jgi:hypothetical protein